MDLASGQREGGLAPGYDDARLSWAELERRRRRRVIIAAVAVGVLALVLAATLLVRNASAHYARGTSAMAAGHYSLAAEELAAARILGFTWRDADALRAEAVARLEEKSSLAAAARRNERRVALLLERALARLTRGDAQAVAAAVDDATGVVPGGFVALDQRGTRALDSLLAGLPPAVGAALDGGRFRSAGLLATAWLALAPGDGEAAAAIRQARRGVELAAILGEARAAAAEGRWTRALELARTVVRREPGFPGAAALVARARAALTPEPGPTTQPTEGAGTGAGSAGTGTPAPPAPPPP